jgi:hypothetical protein
MRSVITEIPLESFVDWTSSIILNPLLKILRGARQSQEANRNTQKNMRQREGLLRTNCGSFYKHFTPRADQLITAAAVQ